MSHHCPTCDITDGPISMGFTAGPMVNGSAEAVPSTSCTICKQPVIVRQEMPVANPLGNKGVRAFAAPLRIAQSEVLPPIVTGGNILKAARARVLELNRVLKQADAWRRERDDLVRLLKASKEKPRANVTPIKAAR